MRRTSPLAAALIVWALAGASAALARESRGVTAAPILRVAMGARAVGMGGAFTALADDLSALHYNPAGLTGISHREVSFMYNSGLEDQDIEWVGASSPLPFAGFFGSGYSTLGVSALFADNGSINVNRTNSDGSFRDSRTLDAGGDFVATLAYAERVANFTLELRDGPYNFDHYMGASAKFIRSSLADRYSATSVAADMGYLLKVPETGTSLGVSVSNFGTEMRFIDEGDPLPLTLRAGFAHKPQVFRNLSIPPMQALTITGDAEYFYYERQARGNVGLEYTAFRRFSVRLGYQVRHDLAGLTFGLGAGWRWFHMDYGWAMTPEVGDKHLFTFTYRFGRVAQRAREAPRRPYIESMPGREDLKDLDQQRPQDVDLPRRPRRAPPENRVAPGWIY